MFSVSWYYTIDGIEYIFHEESVSYDDMKERFNVIIRDCGENFVGFNAYETDVKEYSLTRITKEMLNNGKKRT